MVMFEEGMDLEAFRGERGADGEMGVCGACKFQDMCKRTGECWEITKEIMRKEIEDSGLWDRMRAAS